MSKRVSDGEKLAVLFHDTYEKLAPKFGYETREDTKSFDPKTPNGKLMIAVAKEIIKQTKKPAPKPKIVKVLPTEQMFRRYFFGLSNKQFVQITEEWNETVLKFKLPKKENYDEWLNYFKTISPNAIKQLAVTGLDIIDVEAYAALARWHDIIANPGRIDKIHQSGLTNPNKNGGKQSIVAMALANDRLGVLKATRDQIAEKLEKGAGARDTAALADQMTEIMTQIADYEKRLGPKADTKLGELVKQNERFKERAKGKGARNTSFASRARVTIDDMEV